MYLEVRQDPPYWRSAILSLTNKKMIEWASGDVNAVVNWETKSTSGIRSHKFYKAKQSEFQEDGDNAAWGNWYYSTAEHQGVTYKIGADVDVRGQFFNQSKLDNKVDTQFRAVNDRW